MVFLEPEEYHIRKGRVLQYGTFVFPEGTPRIIRSENKLEFELPNNMERQEVTVQPAQVPFGESVSFYGTGFSGLP